MRTKIRPQLEQIEERILMSRGCRWQSSTIYYYEAMEISGFSREQVRVAVDNAWQDWAKVANIQPVRVSTPAAANVLAESVPMDLGGLGTRGISEIPCATGLDGQATIKINSVVTHDAKSLDSVLSHEIGHSLGLFHSNRNDALMSSAYNGITDPTATDIKAIQKLYPFSQPFSNRPRFRWGGKV